MRALVLLSLALLLLACPEPPPADGGVRDAGSMDAGVVDAGIPGPSCLSLEAIDPSKADAGDRFLGTQGYVWDAQSDMLWAGIGATVALALFSKLHDASMAKARAALSAR